MKHHDDPFRRLEAKCSVGFARFYAERNAHQTTLERLAKVDEILVHLATLVVRGDQRAKPSAQLILDRRHPSVVKAAAYRVRSSNGRTR